jgi:hypothetical protein
MKRVLGRGQRLVIDDRSVPEDDFIDECMNELDWYHDESHVRQYRPSEWIRLLQETGFALETLETYTRHRPLTSLTTGVSPDHVRKIHATIESLTESQRMALHFKEVNGVPHINHWYLILAATTL